MALLDDERGRRRAGATTEPGFLAAAAIQAVVVTAIPELCRLAFAQLGAPAASDTALGPWVWIGLVAQTASVAALRLSYLHAPRYFGVAFHVHGLSMFLWIQAIAWHSLESVPLVGMSLLFAFSIGWAFNDAMQLEGGLALRVLHGASAPVFDAALLVSEAGGHPGLLDLYDRDAAAALNFVAMQAILMLVVQALIHFVGRASREQRERDEVAAEQRRAAAIVDREREVIRRLTGLLQTGITIGRFSHDVAGPLTVLKTSVGVLQDVVQRETLAPADRRLLAELGADIERAVERILEMSARVARTVRTPERARATDLAQLVVDATREMATAVGDRPARVVATIDPGAVSVFVTEAHASAIGSLLANAALVSEGRPIEVTARILDAQHCCLDIRDHGVAPHLREEHVARIRRILDFRWDEDAAVRRNEAYRGYGIGLLLANLVITRHRGWLECATPTSGRGLVFSVGLARIDPSRISDVALDAPLLHSAATTPETSVAEPP
jgi:signal transduction histidine kinase